MKKTAHPRHRKTARAPAAGVWMKRLLMQLGTQAMRDASRIARWSENSIHSLRRRMKKMQSLLRLAAPCVDVNALASLRQLIHGIKGMVAGQRDADVLEALARELGDTQHQPARKPPPTKEIIASTDALTGLVNSMDFQALRWKHVARSYVKTCRRARRAWKRAQQEPSAEALHVWRMRVKDHYHQSLALHHWLQSPKRLRRAHRLGALLGHCHDLDLFAAMLADNTSSAGHNLAASLESKREKLVRRIFQRAEKVFARAVSKAKRHVAARLPAGGR